MGTCTAGHQCLLVAAVKQKFERWSMVFSHCRSWCAPIPQPPLFHSQKALVTLFLQCEQPSHSCYRQRHVELSLCRCNCECQSIDRSNLFGIFESLMWLCDLVVNFKNSYFKIPMTSFPRHVSMWSGLCFLCARNLCVPCAVFSGITQSCHLSKITHIHNIGLHACGEGQRTERNWMYGQSADRVRRIWEKQLLKFAMSLVKYHTFTRALVQTEVIFVCLDEQPLVFSL